MDIPSEGLCESLIKIVRNVDEVFFGKPTFNYLYVFNCENKPNIILISSLSFDNANYIRTGLPLVEVWESFTPNFSL